MMKWSTELRSPLFGSLGSPMFGMILYKASASVAAFLPLSWSEVWRRGFYLCQPPVLWTGCLSRNGLISSFFCRRSPFTTASVFSDTSCKHLLIVQSWMSATVLLFALCASLGHNQEVVRKAGNPQPRWSGEPKDAIIHYVPEKWVKHRTLRNAAVNRQDMLPKIFYCQLPLTEVAPDHVLEVQWNFPAFQFRHYYLPSCLIKSIFNVEPPGSPRALPCRLDLSSYEIDGRPPSSEVKLFFCQSPINVYLPLKSVQIVHMLVHQADRSVRIWKV